MLLACLGEQDLASLATLLAWLILGARWRTALLNAVSVLIVKCEKTFASVMMSSQPSGRTAAASS